ncbi:hypothetical protein LENED_008541 [Lentinula edodes]|uniref:YABBY protein C-terminal domain-containing protein n=1 Tax=Lentinula edodes TaxID=5353 RepID=A0A1Q3EHH9_LENED|nr:hypothetical protein LENED_008541 [Lentinula edodes]
MLTFYSHHNLYSLSLGPFWLLGSQTGRGFGNPSFCQSSIIPTSSLLILHCSSADLISTFKYLLLEMPKASSTSTSKAASKGANAKTSKAPKEKRPPSAYNIFVSEKIKSWKASNPKANAKDAMKACYSKKAKTPKNTSSPPRSSSLPAADDNDVPSSDSVNA